MADPTLPSVVSKMSSLADAWRTYITQVRTWLAGTPTGGPGGDGSYPLTDDLGTTLLVPSPAAQAARVDAVVNSAQSYADSADSSAAAAATSAMNAGSSETAAATHRDDAQTAASTAEMYATAAGNSAADALSSKSASASSESASSASSAAAAQSATDAQTAATSAEASASTATAQATSAASSANDAYASALTAQTAVTGLLHYKEGGWDASSGTFPSTPTEGDFWKITVAGTVGGVNLGVGDQIIYGGTGWDHIDNTESVTSVAGRVGAVVIAKSDIAGLQADLDAKQSLGVAVIGSVGGLVYDTDGAGSVGIRVGNASAGYRYFQFDNDGSFNVLNGGIVGTTASLTGTATAQSLTLTGTGTDTRITLNNGGIRRGLFAINPTGPVGSWVVYTTDGGTPVGALGIGSGGMTYSGGGFTLDCIDPTDVFTVNKPGSSPAGSQITFSSPAGVPGIIGNYAGAKRRDIQFTNSGINLYVSTSNAGGAPQFGFSENGQFTATGGIIAGGGKRLSKITLGTSIPATLADGELFLQF